MKVLFLDINGVCNRYFSTKTKNAHGLMGLESDLCALINKIVGETGCKVVLSSTWRLFEDLVDEVNASIIEVIDVTPRAHNGYRGDEISMWMSCKGLETNITAWAVIDDEATGIPHDWPFFQTNATVGVTPEIAQAIIEYLNTKH